MGELGTPRIVAPIDNRKEQTVLRTIFATLFVTLTIAPLAQAKDGSGLRADCAPSVSIALAAARGVALCSSSTMRTATRSAIPPLPWPTERAVGSHPTSAVTSATSSTIAPAPGFSWGSALIGFAITAGALLLGGAGALTVRRSRVLAHQ